MGTARVIPDAPIVEIAELAGVDIPTNCTSGNCGTCLVRLISGEVDLPEELPLGLMRSWWPLAARSHAASAR